MSQRGRVPPANDIKPNQNLICFVVLLKELIGDIAVYPFAVLNAVTNTYFPLLFLPCVECIQYAAGII